MRLVKTFWLLWAASFIGLFAFPAATATAAPPSVTILMYHHVSETTPPVTSVSPDQLREHLAYLRDNHFNVIGLQQALAGVKGETELPEKAVVITFDDAYQNIFTAGRPILNEFDMPWTLFVTTDPIGETAGQYMNWDQLRTLHQEGVLIANHSSDHAHMPRRGQDESEQQWLARMRKNILHAQQQLEDRVGITNKLFAYPYGEYDNALKELVAELGFIAFGQHSGGFGPTNDLQAIPRFAAAGVYANLRTLGTKMAALSFMTRSVDYDDTLLAHNTTRPVLEVELDTNDFYASQVQCFIGGELHTPEWVTDSRFRVVTEEDVPIGRSRYNCTAPSKKERGRFYWLSIQWIRQDEQGSWPD